jgi:ADP-heptose:LPS heptosyltransferase
MQFQFPDAEPIQSRPWTKPHLPQKVLFIRYHAFGDVLVSLLAAQALKAQLPDAEFHLLVGGAYAELPQNMPVFDKIHALTHARGGWPMALDLLKAYPALLKERYDIVVDLQNNRLSRLVRRVLFSPAWTQFDRFSKIHVLRRYENTVNALGFAHINAEQKIALRDEHSGLEKLREKGWNGRDPLVLLNPCGAFASRQWGETQYLAFAQLWIKSVQPTAKFVLVGYPTLRQRTRTLARELGDHCLDLIGETSTQEVFNIVRRMDLALSDDGALLHAGWVNQVPTIAFLGASPSYWGRPLGEKAFAFTSDDLPCGNCHRTDCIWGDHRCLTRVTPDMAVERAKILLEL